MPSVEALLRSGPLDGLLVLSPPRLHGSHVRAGLEAGVPVLVEKPPACTSAEMEALPADRAGLFGASFTRRGWAGYRRVRGMRAEAWRLVLETDPRRWGAVAQAPLLNDLLPHAIDLAEWLTGSAIRGAEARWDGAAARGTFTLESGQLFGWSIAHGTRYREELWADGRMVLRRPSRRNPLARFRPPEAVAGVAAVLGSWSARLSGAETGSDGLVADFSQARRAVAVLESVIRSLGDGP